MAEILRRGISPNEVAYEYRCTDCDSLIKFFQADRQSDQRDGDYAECPVCKRFIAWTVIVREGKALK